MGTGNRIGKGREMSNCEDMNATCINEFKHLNDKYDKTHDIVQRIDKRLFRTNGDRALVECVRDNKKAIERHIECTKEERKPAQQNTFSGSKDVTKFEIGNLKVTTNNVELASAVMRVVYLLVVIVAFSFGAKFLVEMKNSLHARIDNVEKAVNE